MRAACTVPSTDFARISWRSVRPASECLSDGSLESFCRMLFISSASWRSLGPGALAPAVDDDSAAPPAGCLTVRPGRCCWFRAGSPPALSRARTLRAVSGETPADAAISRSEAPGFSLITSAARRRPSLLSSGRTRPSLPWRASKRGISSVRRALTAPTVFGDSPVIDATDRSESAGLNPSIRAAAALRSAKVSGRPCATFCSTARIKASSSLPSKNSTSMERRPLRMAARSRCIPSMTRIVPC